MKTHECEFYKGLIEDVTIRNYGKLKICCRRCGERLKEEEICPRILKKIMEREK